MLFLRVLGKSSLVSALFRLTEKCGGRIDIDGIDVSHVGLEQLRSRLSIIMQDSVLFSGTVRYGFSLFSLSCAVSISCKNWGSDGQSYMCQFFNSA